MNLKCLNPCDLSCKPIAPTAPNSPILFLCGEGPGKDEVTLRQFFVGKSGMELTNYLNRAGIPRERIYVTDVLKCRTDNEDRDPTVAELRACSKILLQELAEIRPRYIAAVGRVATQWFLGDIDMEQAHGIAFSTSCVYPAGDKVELGFEMVVIPTYHPALGLYESSNMSLIMADFRAVKDAMMRKVTPRTNTAGEAYKGKYEVWDGDESVLSSPIALDTETTGGYNAWSVQFSCAAGSGYFISADDATLLGKLQEFVANPSVKTVLHNALFDIPVLNTINIHPSNYTDTMIMAYLLQTEPQGLKALAFRHLGLRMSNYKDVVGPRTQEMAIEYLLKVMEVEWPKVDPEIVVTGDKVTIRQPQTLNRRANGILTDLAKNPETDVFERWNNISDADGRWLADGMFGPMREAYLRDIDFQTALEYACQDTDATFQIYPILAEKIQAMELEEVLARDVAVLPMLADMMRYGIRVDKEYLGLLSFLFRAEMDELLAEIVGMVGPINPGSNLQVFELLQKLGFEKKPKMYKKATDKGRMELLVGRHPVIVPIMQWKQYKTFIQNNVDVLPESVQADGRIHTHIKATRVVTGRIATSDPNILAIPVRSEDGKKIRKAFIAQKGYTFLSGDFCLEGDTFVTTTEGEIPIRDVKIGMGILSCPTEKNVGIRKVTASTYVGYLPCVEITTDDGSQVICTGEHKWMGFYGEKILAKDLLGKKLAHVKTGRSGYVGYPTWYIRSHFNKISKHVAVCTFHNGPRPDGFEVDHIDANIQNWHKDNLRFLTAAENHRQGFDRYRAAVLNGEIDGTIRTSKAWATLRARGSRSYVGEKNPNYGKRKGGKTTCANCGEIFYQPPCRKAKYCGQLCYRAAKTGNNHKVISVIPVGLRHVFQLTVDGTHNYVLTNGMVSFNSAIEMRVAADQSNDKIMCDIFMRDGDVHTETAMNIFKLSREEVLSDEMKYRYPSKRIGFGVLYGVAAPRLQRELEIAGLHWTEEQCQNLIYDWFGVYQGIRDWMEEIKSSARRNGYVRDMWGRIRLAPELLSVHKQVVEAGERQSCNAMVQMPAQGIIKEAMRQLVPIYKEYNTQGDLIHPIIQIHDDLMWEIRDDILAEFQPVVKQIMEHAAPMMKLPLKVDFKTGKRWGEMEKLK